MQIYIYPETEEFLRSTSEYLARMIRQTIQKNGRCTFALTGGSTAKNIYPRLAAIAPEYGIEWQAVQLFWSDERCVPSDDEESNFFLAKQALLDHITIPPDNIHRMQAELPDTDEACRIYEKELSNVFGTETEPAFDLVSLGLGAEGHFASLFPLQKSLAETKKHIIPVIAPKYPPMRLTWTFPLLNRSRHIVFSISGPDKAEAVYEMIHGNNPLEICPARGLQESNKHIVVHVNKDAANKL